MLSRAIDVVVSGAALLALSPVLAVVGVLIRASSEGPAIYRARRAGSRGRQFDMLKFRTMRVDARRGGAAVTARHDRRVTPLGSVLRRTKIDELPQLVNVLRGEMSIVGPRPEDPRIVADHYTAEDLRTLDVAPGLTSPGSLYNYTAGEAMLDGPDPDAAYASRLLPIKLALDRVYLRRRGPVYDLRIVARTVWLILATAAGRRRFADPPELEEARRSLQPSGSGGSRARRVPVTVLAAGLAAVAAWSIAPARNAAAAGAPAIVQGTAFATGSRQASTGVAMTGPVGAGDLLVGWFAEYNAAGQVQVSDAVNGAWTRGPASLAFSNDTGDIALYYLANSRAAAAGVTVTVRAAAPSYYQGTIAEYSGVAVAGPLEQMAAARGVGTAVDSGATAAVAAGRLVFASFVTGGNPSSASAGATQGVPFTARSQTSSGSAFDEDVAAGAAGAQHGAATLGASTDWYAVVAAFSPASGADTQPPMVPGGLHATGVAATSVGLAWSASTDDVQVTGYTVYRNGASIATTAGTSFTDTTVAPATTYSYAVDAFDAAGNHSAQSSGVPVTTPGRSPQFVQGAAGSPGTRLASMTLVLPQAVAAGDLLVGWFAQYDVAGQVSVSDDINGAWTRSVSEQFTNGAGDITLYYRENSAAAPSGLTVTISAPAPAFLPGAVAEFANVATSGSLDQTAVASGTGTAADSGSTPAVPAGELVVGGLITGGQPAPIVEGSSQNVPFTLAVQNGSGSASMEAIPVGAAGPQDGSFTLNVSTDWYMVAATFRPA